MDASPINSVASPVVNLGAISALEKNSAAIEAQTQVQPILVEITASVVTFSPLAQLLAATILSQSQQADVGGDPITDFEQFAAAANQFVSAFNNFQISSASSPAGSFDATFDNALLLAIQAQGTPQGANGTQSIIDNLAQLGITFNEATSSTNPNQFQIDWTTLEAAFNANPLQASALLSNAFQALGTIEEKLLLGQSTQNSALSTINLALYDSVVAFDSNAFASQVDSLSTADQLTLDIATQAQQADDALLGALGENLTTTQFAAAAANNAADSQILTTAVSSVVAAPNTVAAPVANPVSANLLIATESADEAAINASAVADTAAADLAATNNPASAASNNASALQSTLDPTIIDPLIAVAVAAYRINETVESTPSSIQLNPAPELVEDVGTIHSPTPVELNLHGDAANTNNQSATLATPDQTPSHAAKNKSPSPHVGVDISV